MKTTLTRISDKIAAEAIIRSVADEFNLSPTALTGKRRQPKIVRARHKAMFMIREALALSYPELGGMFNRDHSSVIHAVNSYRAFYLPKSLGLPTEKAVSEPGRSETSDPGISLH